MTKGSLSLQSPLPFTIKKEPVDDTNSCLTEDITVNNENEKNNTGYQREIEMIKASIKSLKEHFQKELQDLKKNINDMNSQKSGHFIESGNERTKINNLETQLSSKNVEHVKLLTSVEKIKITLNDITKERDKLLIEIQMAKQEKNELSTQHELLLKSISGQHPTEISALKKTLDDITKERDTLVVDNQTVKEEKKELSTQHELVLKSISDEHATEMSELKKTNDDIAKERDKLVVENQTATKEKQDISTQHELMPKSISDEHATNISVLKKTPVSSETKERENFNVENQTAKEQMMENSLHAGSSVSSKSQHDLVTSKQTDGEQTPAKLSGKNEEKKDKRATKRKLIRTSTGESSTKKTKRTFKTTTDHEQRHEHYEVERILNHKIENNQTLFLIRWKGYDEADDLYLTESDLFCPGILNEYKKTHNLI